MSEPTAVDVRPLAEALEKGLSKGLGDLNQALSPLGSFVAQIQESQKPGKEVANLAEAAPGKALSGFTALKVWEVPVGAIAIGTFGGVFIQELLEGFMAKQSTQTKGLIKLAAAGAVAGFGKRWLGKDAAFVIALTLGVFGLSQVVAIDKWAAKLASGLKGQLPGTIKVTGIGRAPTQGSAVAQAAKVADYYAAAEGR